MQLKNWKYYRKEAKWWNDPADFVYEIDRDYPNIIHRHITSYMPTDVDNILEILEIKVINSSNSGWFSACRIDNNNPYIWVDEYGSKTTAHERVNIAHQLAHIILHDCSQDRRCVSPGIGLGSASEIQADEFALALLMPRWLLQPLIYHTKLQVPEMAKIFDVPVPTIGFQINNILNGKG